MTKKQVTVFEIRFLGPKATPKLTQAFENFELFLVFLAQKFADDNGLFSEVVKRSKRGGE